MRMGEGGQLRLFDGQNGEFLAEITALSKKALTLTCIENLIPQPPAPAPVHLLFAPIKKQRLDTLIEKAVELGATHLHPVITDHTENRALKQERIHSQIIEAAEQCERLDLPYLFEHATLNATLTHWSHTDEILWAAERTANATPLSLVKPPAAFLIGPEGGFSENERQTLAANPLITPVTLGPRILRAETAVFYMLARINA